MSGFQYPPMGFDASTVVVPHYFNSVASVGSAPGGLGVTIGAGGRNSTNGLIATITSPSNGASTRAIKTLPSPLTTIYQSFPFTLNRLLTVGNTLIVCELRDNGTTQVDVRMRSDGKFIVTRNGTQIGPVSTYTYSANTFPFFEIKAVIDNSAGAVDVLANEVSIFGGPITGVDTQATANNFVTEFVVGAAIIGNELAGTGSIIVIFDDIGTRDDAYSGNFRVRERLPTGTGDVDDGVPGGSSPAADTQHSVDETPPNDDVDKAALQNVGDKFLLTYAAIPTNEEVLCACLVEYAKISAAGTGKYKGLVKIGGTEHLGSVEKAPNAGSYAYFGEVQMVSPATGVQYTASELNGAQFGAQKTA